MSQAATKTTTKISIKPPSMWQVKLINDDFTPMDFVTEVLMYVFHKSFDEAKEIMLTVHNTGAAVVGLYTKDVAITKADQVVRLAESKGHPLLCKAEEA